MFSPARLSPPLHDHPWPQLRPNARLQGQQRPSGASPDVAAAAAAIVDEAEHQAQEYVQRRQQQQQAQQAQQAQQRRRQGAPEALNGAQVRIAGSAVASAMRNVAAQKRAAEAARVQPVKPGKQARQRQRQSPAADTVDLTQG